MRSKVLFPILAAILFTVAPVLADPLPEPYQVGLQITPNPAVAGEMTHVDLVVRHLGQPVRAVVVMKPEMPAMPGMSSPVVQAVPGPGPGEYRALVPLAMEGDWNLRVGIVGPFGREEKDFAVTAVSPGTNGWATRGGSGSLLFGIFAGLIVAATALAFIVKKRRSAVPGRGK